MRYETYYADARFYRMKGDQEKGKEVAEDKDILSASKSPFVEFNKPVTQLDCEATETYRRFKPPKNRKAKKPIIFHVLGNMESHAKD